MKEILNNQIKEHRVARKMTQQDLAQVTGVSRESGKAAGETRHILGVPLTDTVALVILSVSIALMLTFFALNRRCTKGVDS